ncbi:hypothetical protein [Sporosarcina sp. FSL W7-1283]|uniref:hypothetical protein n=1 Tax=Sporosarcina sp. FSL W7-1283 TaxID=2921560 RepID=UPI0030FC38FE
MNKSKYNVETERLGISEETLESMKKIFTKTFLPLLLEKRQKEEAEKESEDLK